MGRSMLTKLFTRETRLWLGQIPRSRAHLSLRRTKIKIGTSKTDICRCRSLLKATVTSKWRRRVASRRKSWTRFHLGPTLNGTGGAKKVDGSISTGTRRASKACDTKTFWAEEKLFIIDFVNESAILAIRLLHFIACYVIFC